MTADGPQTLLGQALKYGVAGVASTALYTLTTVVMVEFANLDPVISSLSATSVTIVFSYFVNYHWVFTATGDHASSFFRFLAATCLALILNAALMYLTVHVLGYWYGLGMFLVILITTPTNFTLNYFWCFAAPKQHVGTPQFRTRSPQCRQ